MTTWEAWTRTRCLGGPPGRQCKRIADHKEGTPAYCWQHKVGR